MALTKKDLQEIALIMKEEIAPLKVDIVTLREDIATLKQDVVELKEDVGGLKEDVIGLKRDFGTLKKDNKSIRQEFKAFGVEIFNVFLTKEEFKYELDKRLERFATKDDLVKVQNAVININKFLEGEYPIMTNRIEENTEDIVIIKKHLHMR